MNVANDECLLTYLPSTYPTPLQVSTSQTSVTGILNTAALNESTGEVYCNEILIAVPVGPDPGDLFASSPTPSASCNTSKWAITSLVFKSGRELGFDNDIEYAVFTFDCRSQTDYLIDYNLVFGVQGQMIEIMSDCAIMVLENSGTTKDPSTFTSKQTSYTVSANAPQFYLQNFVATAPASPTVPATDFPNGADIVFSWESNGSYFQLYQKNISKPIYQGMQTTFKLSGGVSRDTTFFLVAMMSGNPSGDSPSGNYQPIYLYDALTITISNPDLTPRSATISANASVSGTLGVTGQTSLGNTNVSGTLGVTGQTTLGNANLNNATVADTLSVTGETALANTKVGGMLSALSQTNLAKTDIAGLATLTGGLLGTGNFVSLFTGAQIIQPGKFTAKTDGFVIGTVMSPYGNNANKLCVCWIFGQTWGQPPDIYVYATGGNLVCFNSSGTRYQLPNNQSFLMPVRKGANWELGVGQDSSNQAPALVYFWWIPLGMDSSGQTFEKISDQQSPFEGGRVLQTST
jgi:hypothetical protein